MGETVVETPQTHTGETERIIQEMFKPPGEGDVYGAKKALAEIKAEWETNRQLRLQAGLSDLRIWWSDREKQARLQALRWTLELIEREKYDGYYCDGLPVSVVHADTLKTKFEAMIKEASGG